MASPFLRALGLGHGDVAAIIGAGGKTSLMFRLAGEARSLGMRVLVTTSTRILLPEPGEYDHLDLSGRLFVDSPPERPGIYVGGIPDETDTKIMGVRDDLLAWSQRAFDLVLIEADGAASKPLKGWRENEPVIPEITSVTIGVLDISTIGSPFTSDLVHRPERFGGLVGADQNDNISLGHLLRLVAHEDGLFARALGREILYINKVESPMEQRNAALLKSQFDDLRVVIGSILLGEVYG